MKFWKSKTFLWCVAIIVLVGVFIYTGVSAYGIGHRDGYSDGYDKGFNDGLPAKERNNDILFPNDYPDDVSIPATESIIYPDGLKITVDYTNTTRYKEQPAIYGTGNITVTK